MGMQRWLASCKKRWFQLTQNAASLDAVDRALFVLCLDELVETNPQKLAHNLIHGHAKGANLNRWFDKSFSLIVHKNGGREFKFGASKSHRPGLRQLRALVGRRSGGAASDGGVVRRLDQAALLHKRDCGKGPKGGRRQFEENRFARKVKNHNIFAEFALSDATRNQIASAASIYEKWTANLDFSLLEYEAMNRATIKKSKLSPDAVIQAAIQVDPFEK